MDSIFEFSPLELVGGSVLVGTTYVIFKIAQHRAEVADSLKVWS